MTIKQNVFNGGGYMGLREHRHAAPTQLGISIITVSDTRTHTTDKSGALLKELFTSAHHSICGYEIVPDDRSLIQEVVRLAVARDDVHAVILTGGTGISARDITFEAIRELLDKEIPGYGELFRRLSFEEIGPAAILSRAIAGVANRKVVIATPGSTNAVKLAVEKIILPELGHLVSEATRLT